MGKNTISDLPLASALTGDELVEIEQGGDSRQTTAQDIADLASGGGGSLGYDVYAATLTQVAGTTAESGPLVVGRPYRISTYVAGDDFSNVANVLEGAINTEGCIFEATGTTPTTWANGSILDVFQYIETPLILGTNTIGSIVWEFDPIKSLYTGTLADAFTTDGSTVCFSSFGLSESERVLEFEVLDTDTVRLELSLSDGAGSVSLEIRVYP